LLSLLAMTVTILLVWLLTGAQWVDVFQFLTTQQVGPDAHGLAVALSYYMTSVNLLLAVFNLLPLPPLDGFNALVSVFSLVSKAFRRGSARQRSRVAPPASTTDHEKGRSAAQIHFDIGLAYHQDGEMSEAIARYRQAIAQDERFGLAYYNLGLAYWAKGKTSLAAGAFRAASQSAADLSLRSQAQLRLREISQAAQAPPAGLVPPPLEPGQHRSGTPQVGEKAAERAAPLDPAAARRVWVRLSLGGAGMLALAVIAWLFVALVTLTALMPGS
jgi:tetratricopeptide (TPR) repeat protein